MRENDIIQPNARPRSTSTRLNESIIMSTLGQRPLGDETAQLKTIFYNIIDNVIVELNEHLAKTVMFWRQ